MEEQNIILFVFANKEIPGRVAGKTPNGSVFIKPLIDRIPLQDGGFATEFFARARDAGGAKEGEFITFFWSQPGERGLHPTTNQPDKPVAQNVRVVSEAIAYNLIDEILVLVSNSQKEDLQNQIESNKLYFSQQQLNLEKEYQVKNELLNTKIQDADRKIYELEQEILSVKSQEDFFSEEWRELQEKEKELDRVKQEINRYTALLPLIDNSIQSRNISHISIPKTTDLEPENLGTRWHKILASRNMTLPESITIGYLISTLAALYSGGIVLLNGSVGVGKTSIISKSAKVLGGEAKIVPVRPSWLDPSDLLGFFDPLAETFRSSFFTIALKQANNCIDKPFLICLDELNLARIENYGADLLSTLEYSKNKKEGEEHRKLQLYSEEIETELWHKLHFLKNLENPNLEQQLLIQKMEKLGNTPANLEIPQNLVLIGTLNSDETTYDLSPKVIDRSYVITYPPAKLGFLHRPYNAPEIEGEQLSVSKFRAKVEYCIEIIKEREVCDKLFVETEPLAEDLAEHWQKDWQKIIDWNEEYISKLGIPIGHRIKREYQMFFSVCHCLGIANDNPNSYLAYFIFIKLLPRLSFFKNGIRETLCQEWINEIRDNYSIGGESYILDQINEQISDSRRRNVRYWG